MKILRALWLSLVVLSIASPGFAADSIGKIRVLLITGGHDFEQPQFFKLFNESPEITVRIAEHPHAHELLRPESATNYDVLVAYDMYQEISETAKGDLVNWLKQGKGLVVLHHAIASYQAWPEYSRIIGAHYYLEKSVVNGVQKPRSTYQHAVHFRVHVVDPTHPVTKGIEDFDIYDETYNLFDVTREVHPLLTTEEALSNRIIAWAKNYGSARVVYLQSGHDHFAYENPNYQRILKQALLWVANRD
jgi:hypothetical protein